MWSSTPKVALSINSNWLDAFAAEGTKPVYIVEIQVVTGGTTEGVDLFSFITGDRSLFGLPASIARVSPIASRLNVFSREITVGGREITFKNDGVIRQVINDFRLKNKLVKTFIGAQGLARADFVEDARVLVDDIQSSQREISIRCSDAMGLIRDRDLRIDFLNQHPLQAIEKILQRTSVPASLYDATTLDPANYPLISHWNTTRSNLPPDSYGDLGIDEPESCQAMINQLLVLMNGTLSPGAQGIYTFKQFDDSVVTKTLEISDVGNLKQVSTYDMLRNQIGFNFIKTLGEPNFRFSHKREDAASITEHGTVSKMYSTPWLNGYARTSGGALGEGTGTLVVDLAGVSGFCGGRHIDTSTPQLASAKLSATRPAILRIIGTPALQSGFGNAVTTEYVRCEAATLIDYIRLKNGVYIHRSMSFTVTERNIDNGLFLHDFSSQQSTWNVVDVTIPRQAALDSRVERFSRGVARLRYESDMRDFGVQIGDILILNHKTPIQFGKDGADSGVKWETVFQEADPSRSQATVFELVQAGVPVPTVTSSDEDDDFTMPITPEAITLSASGSPPFDLVTDSTGDILFTSG